MTIKTTRKIGFFTAMAMLLGTVVGIGIFFKNASVQGATNGNGVSWLLAWVIGGLISLAAAVSFSEIGTMKLGKIFSLAGWVEKLGGTKFGYFVRSNYAFFYFAMLHAVLGFFGSEAIVLFIYVIKNGSFGAAVGAMNKAFPIYGHVLIGLALSTFFLVLNYISVKVSGVFQTVTTVLKFLPLIIAVVVGTIFANTHNLGGSGKNAFTNGGAFQFKGLIVALPAVLFAYDAFLVVAQISPKVKGGEKKTAWIVMIGMIIVISLYTLIAISSILHNQGIIGFVLEDSLPKSISKIINIVLYGFLFISTIGVINGVSAANVAIFEQNIELKTFAGSKTLSDKIGNNKTALVYMFSCLAFWTVAFAIPTIIGNSDSYVDGFSNVPVTLFFGIYAITILLYTIKRNKQDTKKMNNILFNIFAWIAIISITFIVAYVIFVGFIDGALSTPSAPASWGLFQAGKGVNHLTQAIVFFSLTIVFVAFPFLNRFLAKKFENREVAIDTSEVIGTGLEEEKTESITIK